MMFTKLVPLSHSESRMINSTAAYNAVKPNALSANVFLLLTPIDSAENTAVVITEYTVSAA